MINWEKKSLHVAASLLCAAAVSLSSLNAQECCPLEDDCCSIGWSTLLLPIAAGAGTSYAVSKAMKNRGKRGKHGFKGSDGINGIDGTDGIDGHDGKRGAEGHGGRSGHSGCRGCTGPMGEPGEFCIADIGEALTFGFNLTINPYGNYSSGSHGQGIIPFVETPEGVVVEGEQLDPEVTNTNQTAMLTINNPCYGTYHFGYFIPEYCGASGGATIDVLNIVQATRDESTTGYPETFYWESDCYKVQQITQDYTYIIEAEEEG